MGMDELMSVGEAARRLGGLSKWTIYSWLSQGKLRRTKVGSRTMIAITELEHFIEAGNLTAESGAGGLKSRKSEVDVDTLSPDSPLT